jgi:hypothetical protein
MTNTDIIKALLDQQFAASARGMRAAAESVPYGVTVINGQSVGGTTATNAIQLTWPCDGYLTGIRVSTRDAASASLGGMLLRITVDGQEELFPSGTGSGAGYMSFWQITGTDANRLAVTRRFRQATQWQVYLNNTTGGTLVADLAFEYVNVQNPRIT